MTHFMNKKCQKKWWTNFTSPCNIAYINGQFIMKHGHYAPDQSSHITMFVLDAQGIKVFPKSFPKRIQRYHSLFLKNYKAWPNLKRCLLQELFLSCMHVYTKPRGGQKAYKGHVITLPQDVQQLADVLPRCPQELPVIVFTIAGKDNKSPDFLVRRQKVAVALYWLTGTNENGEPNNYLYQNITIDNERLKALPENNTLSTIPDWFDLVENTDSDEDQVNIDVGPVDSDDNERV